MKKLLSATLMLILFLCVFTNEKVKAKDYTDTEIVSYEKIELGNGLYKEITVFENHDIHSTRATSSKSGYKTASYKSGNTTLWSITVNGSFTYNGNTSSCTSASSSAASYNSNWKISNHYAKRNGSTATAYVVAKNLFFGITVNTVEDDISLTCSKLGVLS